VETVDRKIHLDIREIVTNPNCCYVNMDIFKLLKRLSIERAKDSKI
jgi:hypothetical protein